MLSCTDGGDWFIRHFVLIVMTVMVDSTSHGYTNTLLMDHLRDVDRVAQMNWCEYVLDKLIDNKLKWDKSNRKIYCGPLLVLMVFYVDRVGIFTKRVARKFPALQGWTGKELRERENEEVRSGGFGAGHDCGPLDKVKRIELSEMSERNAAPSTLGVGDSSAVHSSDEQDLKVLVREFAAKSKILASTIIDMITMVQEAPKELSGCENFCNLRDLGNKLIGVTPKCSSEKKSK